MPIQQALRRLKIPALLAILGLAGCHTHESRSHDREAATDSSRVEHASVPSSREHCVASIGGPDGTRATWMMRWDDGIDGVLGRDWKSCQLALHFDGNVVDGAFAGPVLGKPRDARFVGELIPGRTPLLLLKQLEPDYVGTFQLRSLTPGTFTGVWHDNLGRHGDVQMSLFVESKATDVSSTR